MTVASRVNWESGANLAGLADELQLGLDTFMLVDDNPKECTEAQASCPEVLTLTLPAEPGEIPEFLRHVWAFDHGRITDEDRSRSALYARQVERTRLQRSSASLEDFIQSLGLEVRIGGIEAAQAPRVAQLTQRTNQMNLTCVRRTGRLLHLGKRCLVVEIGQPVTG
jgi:FkbH-like protein